MKTVQIQRPVAGAPDCDAPSKQIERTFRTWDETELFYRAWLPAKAARKAVVLFHRGHEHSGRWQETVEGLGLKDAAVFAWDARGHGRSPGQRGSAENLGVIIRDMESFVHHVSSEYGIPVENMVVMAQSVGAVAAAAWVHDFAPPVRGLILAVPAFRVKLYVPLAVPLLRLRQKIFGHGYVKSYVKAKMLTHDAGQAAAYAADPLIFRQIAVNVLLDLYDTSTRLMADAAAITAPTLMFEAGADWVVRRSAQRKFFDGLSSKVKRYETLPGFYHAVFHEKGRQLVWAKAREFILECFERAPAQPSLIDADRRGFTKEEYDRLCSPGSPVYGATRLGMKTLGRLSRGIQLGWEAGFDSGRTLDYVYENKPLGITPPGRAIDRNYLNSIGWRGIRVRKENMRKVLRDAIESVHGDGKPVRILDIASGPGRYVLETVRDLPAIPASVSLRDYKRENVKAAQWLAAQLGLRNVTAVEGDAFDRDALTAVTPKPTVAIVSGLYELFPQNEPVLNSLRGLADAMEPGSLLVYTNQPWHPQMEFIARVLRNREGKPWIMRRRTQAEMDELVRAAGFEKVRQEIDQWGIFSVSLARRVNS
jgi:alpha-beta hydrolase superfamily lysophospholipase/SAM-dependent methyltransferase